MKIALIALRQSPIRVPYAGGTEKFIYELATGLAARGHDITVFAAEGSRIPGATLKIIPALHTYDVHPPTPSMHMLKDFEHYRRVAYLLQNQSFEAVVDSSLKDGFLNFASYLPCPVFKVHHVPLEKAVLNTMIEEQSFFGRVRHVFVSNSMLRAAPGIIHTHVVHNGVRTKVWSPEPEGKTIEKKPILCWSGRILPDKGTHHALEAALLAGVPIQFAGPINDEVYFEKKVKPLVDGEKVIYRGHLSPGELARMVAQSRCAVFSSVWSEPFGYVLAEAMACGTPVAGFDIGAASEVHTPQTAALTNIYTSESLAKCIPKALTLNPKLCRRRARAHFSVQSMLTKYETLLQQSIEDYAALRYHPQSPARNLSRSAN